MKGERKRRGLTPTPPSIKKRQKHSTTNHKRLSISRYGLRCGKLCGKDRESGGLKVKHKEKPFFFFFSVIQIQKKKIWSTIAVDKYFYILSITFIDLLRWSALLKVYGQEHGRKGRARKCNKTQRYCIENHHHHHLQLHLTI